MSIENIQGLLLIRYSKDSYYPKVQENWNDNKCFGMRAITSLIINDYYFLFIIQVQYLQKVIKLMYQFLKS